MAEERRSIQTILAARKMFGDDVLALKFIFSSYHGVAHARIIRQRAVQRRQKRKAPRRGGFY